MLRRAQVAYLAREAVSGFRRRKLTTGVTILIMGSALLVLALFTLVSLNLGVLLEGARSGIDIRVFLREEPDAVARADLQGRLLALPGVQAVGYIGKEQALREFREQLGPEAGLLDELQENPLPASFQIRLNDDARGPDAVARLARGLREWPEVDDAVWSEGWVATLERWTLAFRLASLVVGLVVFIAAVFVISNTVKLTVASSERVIEVMKLVGATNAFIRTPFVWEGMLEGLLGGLLAMGLLCGGYAVLQPRFAGLVFFTPAQIAGFVLFCVGLGLIGSWAAMRKYLRL